MMKRNIILFSLYIYISFFTTLAAQDSEIDSLENSIKNYKKEDTIKVNLLNELTPKLFNTDNDKALKYALEAGKLSDKMNFGKGKAQAYRLVAIAFYYKSQYPMSLEYFQKSWKANEEIGDTVGISKCLNNIGAIHYSQRNYIEALEYYKKSLEIDRKLNDKQGITKSFNNIGVVYYDLKNFPEAIKYYKKSLKIKKELGDIKGISVSYNNLAEIYEEQNKLQLALEYHKKSLKLKAKTSGNDLGAKSSTCITYFNIGTVYLKMKNIDKALNYTLKALDIAKELQLLDRQKEIYEILYRIYKAKKQYKKSLEYYISYKIIEDSIFSEKNVKKITGLEYQYKYEKEKEIASLKQQKKDEIAKKELKYQESVRNSFIVGFALMLLLALVVLYSFIQKRKANKILALQKNKIQETNDELNQTNKELNATLEVVKKQKTEIEKSNRNIKASINAASRIQHALLPSNEMFSNYFHEYFILFNPKDVVSGDFYYLKKIDKYIVVVAADCTGHGVPGAFVSMLGISFLNEIIQKEKIKTAAQILEELRIQIKTSLKQTHDKYSNKDGMDIALCVINTETNILNYAGAYNPLYFFRNGKLEITKATRNPIAFFVKEKPFQNNEIQLQKKDRIYIFSDGYIDQFGGERGNKFKAYQFRKLLTSLQEKNLKEQAEILNTTLINWKTDKYQQVDDILVIGLEI